MSKVIMRIYVPGSKHRIEGIKLLLERKNYDIFDMKIIESCAYNESGHWLIMHVDGAKTRNSIAEFLDLRNLRHKVNWAF